MMYYFAQTPSSPSNGASRAEDFQPPTQNPQTVGGGVQSGSSSQQVGGQDILSGDNARLVVPAGNSGQQTNNQMPPNSGINWLFVAGVSVVIVVALELLFRQRERRKLAVVASEPDQVDTKALDAAQHKVQQHSRRGHARRKKPSNRS